MLVGGGQRQCSKQGIRPGTVAKSPYKTWDLTGTPHTLHTMILEDKHTTLHTRFCLLFNLS